MWQWRTAGDELTADPAEAAGAASIPAGLSIHHGDHDCLVIWTPVAGFPAAFTVDSLLPLTVAEAVRCPTCGVMGWIADDRWVPVPSSSGAAA